MSPCGGKFYLTFIWKSLHVALVHEHITSWETVLKIIILWIKNTKNNQKGIIHHSFLYTGVLTNKSEAHGIGNKINTYGLVMIMSFDFYSSQQSSVYYQSIWKLSFKFRQCELLQLVTNIFDICKTVSQYFIFWGNYKMYSEKFTKVYIDLWHFAK